MRTFALLATGLAGSLALTACTTPVREQKYTPTATAQMPMEQARAECEFQVEAATASIGAGGYKPKGTTFDQELAQAFADGVIKGDEQNKLFKTCMHSKGFAGK